MTDAQNPGGRKRPCYGCTNRKVGCHASCEIYLKEREDRLQYLEERQKEVILDNYKSEAAIRTRGKKPGFRLKQKQRK